MYSLAKYVYRDTYMKISLLLWSILIITPLAYASTETKQPVSNIMSPKKELFTLSRYGDNYLLPYYFSAKPNQNYFAPQNPNSGNIDKASVQFQFSLKYGLLANFFTDNDGLYFSYTQTSDWQAYDDSAYFRDTQYQPELFWTFVHAQSFLDLHWQQTQVGFIHQSNGKGGKYERSWNRAFVNMQFNHGNFTLNLRPWVRLHIYDSRDYNPDIYDYLGYGDINLGWQSNNHRINLLLRNQLESGFKNGYERLSWQFPIYKKLHGYLKLESGYGMTISNYNHYDNAFGIGIAL